MERRIAPSADKPPEPAHPSGSEPSPKPRQIVHAGNVEFECLERSDLAQVPVVVQALDNQWLPRKLSSAAFKRGSLDKQADKKLRQAVRSEYLRSLINTEQLVLNRAYLYNNPAVSQDYARGSRDARESFKALLEQGVILPYLMNEQTPVDTPGFGVHDDFRAWQSLCQEVRLRCVRLSWNDQENRDLINRQLVQRFNKFVVAAGVGDIATYLRDLGLDASAEQTFRKRLTEVGQWCLDKTAGGSSISRNELYKTFITAGDNPANRLYDGDRPFAAEIKQLFDLNYNCNLPDALGGYLYTPADSLPRTALQEWQQALQRKSVSADEVVAMVRRMAFGLVAGGLNLDVIARLSLNDVREIRNTDEWRAYIEAVRKLVSDEDLFGFADYGAERVYRAYLQLAKRITDRVEQQGHRGLLSAWTPVVEVAFSIAGAVLIVVLTPAGPVFQVLGQVAASVGGGAVPIVGRLVIRGLARKRGQQDLSTSIDFMKQNMANAREHWRDLVGQVRSLSGFEEVQIPQEQRTVDPAVTYQEPEY